MFKYLLVFLLFSTSLFSNNLQISSISEEEKKLFEEIDPQNLEKDYRDNNIFIGKHGKYLYSDMDEYGRFIEEHFSKSKIYLKKYNDYLLYRKFKEFLFPPLFIETDRKNIEILISGIADFYQGIHIERDKEYRVSLIDGNERIDKIINFKGERVVVNFGKKLDFGREESTNREFMWKLDRRFFGNWKSAKKYCRRTEHEGFSDWRLPTLLELWHVKNRETNKKSLQISDKSYWSGDEFEEGKVWGIDMNTGSDKIFDSQDKKNAICVRGDSEFGEPTKLEKIGKVLNDPKREYMWSVGSQKVDWRTARIECINSESGKFTDWRLPTIRELYTLRGSKAVNGSFWSGTDFYLNDKKAWGFNTNSQKDTWNKKSLKRDVICIRRENFE
jgi:hypothetical protein